MRIGRKESQVGSLDGECLSSRRHIPAGGTPDHADQVAISRWPRVSPERGLCKYVREVNRGTAVGDCLEATHEEVESCHRSRPREDGGGAADAYIKRDCVGPGSGGGPGVVRLSEGTAGSRAAGVVLGNFDCASSC